MSEDLKLRKARSVYRKVNEAIEKNGWSCKCDEQTLALAYGIKTEEDGEPVNFVIKIDAERQLVRLETQPLMKFDSIRLIDAALAVCTANVILADGSFDLKLKGGALAYRQALVFRESTNLSLDAITYLLNYSVYAVNSFLSKFKLVNEDKIKGADFLAACRDII